LFNTLRIDADPTSWELFKPLEQLPTFNRPAVLEVYHPLRGELVLSPRSVGSAVFLEFSLTIVGTRPNGMPIPEPFLYLPSPIGPDVHSIPPNFYPIPGVDLAALKAEIIAAMTGGTFLTMNVTGGVVVINGAEVPFVVIGPAHP
jgi:hypothetical protein